jgi:hypothetical protein
MSGRCFALPEDLQTVLPGVIGHRLIPINETTPAAGATMVEDLLTNVPIP